RSLAPGQETETSRVTLERDDALEQQSATTEVLRIISSFSGDLQPVFTAVLENAVRICGARFGNLALFDGRELRIAATHNTPPTLENLCRERPMLDLTNSASGPLVRTKKVVHIVDLAAEEPYAQSALAKLGGARTALAIPMLRDDTLVGQVAIYRQDVRPFTEKQIGLATNFAAQAVIAIGNARLLKELRARTEQLEAKSQEVVRLNQQLEQRVADQLGEIERMSRLRRFLPQQVADLIVASGTEKQL